ncbi:TRAP transporter large permease subunit [Pseudomonadota bacterium]|nr:TRAP transporter large permease subunit [Pseudomonadota bacterium]MDC0199218.1 TRAP transporter large permease subunit [Pseudomonadota bacterium]
MEIIPILLIVLICAALLLGYPVAFTLAGTSILFALLGIALDFFDPNLFKTLPMRIFGIMNNQTLLAVPLFVFMGVVLERSGIAAKMLRDMAIVFKNTNSGLSISIIIVGALLAASTGIVGATVVTMGLMSLPAMLKQGYDKDFASGLVASTGTLGQIIPPSIALVLLGDVMSNAYQRAQNNMGVFSQETVSVGDLFVGAIVPGIMIVAGYLIYTIIINRKKEFMPIEEIDGEANILKTLLPPATLIFIVLGSIIAGIATPTEAAGVGAFGALIIAGLNGSANPELLRATSYKAATVTTMIFSILIGASIFSLIFRGVGGDLLVDQIFEMMPGGNYTALFFILFAIFLFGFILDFIEICYVIIPLVAPPLLMMGFDPVWLGILMAINLQTSFLTPPFGFSLFYLRGVADESIETKDIYKGVVPFIIIQLMVLITVIIFPFFVL